RECLRRSFFLFFCRCWCSNSSSYDEHGSSKYCNFPCPGDSDETCGGGWAMMVSESSSYG
ncbi:unnamed protein product, partial [Scytosiphon promiscuus]